MHGAQFSVQAGFWGRSRDHAWVIEMLFAVGGVIFAGSFDQSAAAVSI
jgi:hypothetical protein